MTLVTPWASLGRGESGPYLVLSQTRGLWSPPGPHLDLVNLVPIWASPSPGDFVPTRTSLLWTISWPHLELVTLILSARHPDLVIWSSPGHHCYLVTLFLT